jgi:Zn-finger nucleic acid-binding protein
MPQDAGGLHCPNCGSPAGADQRVCGYCQAELATVSCPSCFALMFAGSAYCPHCGAAAARAAAETPTKVLCPACRTVAMRHVQVGPTDLLECTKCGGAWVAADAFERLCADRDAQAAVLHQWGPAPARPRPQEIRYRPCPDCGRMMNRVNFGRLSGAIVDVCKGHGTFLDSGELHQIVRFIQGGGLERSRQRQLEDLRQAEAELRAAEQAQAVRGAALPDAGAGSHWNGPDLLELLRRLRG